MNIAKDKPKDLPSEDVCPKKKRTFWDDPEIGKKLDAIPEKERSVNIRMALRQYFGITPKQAQDINQLREIFQIFQSAGR